MASAEIQQEPWWRTFGRTNGLLAIVLLAGTIVLLIQQSTWLLGTPEILYGDGRESGYMVSNRLITSMLLVSVVLNSLALVSSGKRRLWLLGWSAFLLVEFLIIFSGEIERASFTPETWNSMLQLPEHFTLPWNGSNLEIHIMRDPLTHASYWLGVLNGVLGYRIYRQEKYAGPLTLIDLFAGITLLATAIGLWQLLSRLPPLGFR